MGSWRPAFPSIITENVPVLVSIYDSNLPPISSPSRGWLRTHPANGVISTFLPRKALFGATYLHSKAVRIFPLVSILQSREKELHLLAMTGSYASTEPSPNTYMLGTRFTAPVDDVGIPAVAVLTSYIPLIITVYTLQLIVLSEILWALCSNAILGFLPIRNRFQAVGMTSLWNSNQPWKAVEGSFSYLWTLWRHAKKYGGNHGDVRFGFIMLVPSLVIAVGSLLLGIIYTNLMTLGNFAPVHPDAIFFPYISDSAASTASHINSILGPAVLRALGSAEAFDRHSQRSKVSIEHMDLSGSTDLRPEFRLDYSYNISASEFGFQTSLGLSFRVQGSCSTEYGWLWPDSSNLTEGLLEEYHPWNQTQPYISVPGPATTGGHLDFWAVSGNNEPDVSNKTFSLFALTSRTASYTPSTDPWFYTEPLNDTQSSGNALADVGYIVKAGRPALSCWEDTKLCSGEHCVGPLYEGVDLPDGLKFILVVRTAVPTMAQLGAMAGVSVLRSYIGSMNGYFVDAASSSMEADIRRLVLASYLYTREAFRDTAMTPQEPGLINWVEDSQGKLMDGADAFVILAGQVQALRLDLLILVPALLGFLGLLSIATNTVRKGHIWDSPPVARSRLDTFRAWSVLLTAPQLFRMVSEKSDNEGVLWNCPTGTTPIPSDGECVVPVIGDRPTISFVRHTSVPDGNNSSTPRHSRQHSDVESIPLGPTSMRQASQ